MIEIENVKTGLADIRRRLALIDAELERGANEDWVTVAEQLDNIKEVAKHIAANAWRTSYELSPEGIPVDGS